MCIRDRGYGAQGGTAEDIAQYLAQGNGGVVNSSRSVLLLSLIHISKGSRNSALLPTVLGAAQYFFHGPALGQLVDELIQITDLLHQRVFNVLCLLYTSRCV